MKVAALWYRLRSSYWFVPALMTAAAAGLAFLMLSVDRNVGPEAAILSWTYSGGAEGARTLLSTVAGSMITVAGVVFSITIVALSLTTSQFGPRLLVNFMRDAGNQIVLGVFLATYAYCLVVLRAVRSGDEGLFVPHLGVTVGIGLAAASVCVLIFFIHHVSTSIQAENIIAAVRRDLDSTIEQSFVERARSGAAEDDAESAPAEWVEQAEIRAPKSGYVQGIDDAALIRLASEEDLVVDLRRRPGKFTVEGELVAWAAPREQVKEETARKIAGSFVIGSQRTPTQDVEFAIFQLVEVAVRALSPGINDPHTAMACIDWLGSALCRIARWDIPPAERRDGAGQVRLIVDTVTYEGLVDAAFNEIRQHGRGNVAVSIRLLDAIATIAEFARDDEQRRVLRRHADMVERGSCEAAPEPFDREEIMRRKQRVVAALEGSALPPGRPA